MAIFLRALAISIAPIEKQTAPQTSEDPFDTQFNVAAHAHETAHRRLADQQAHYIRSCQKHRQPVPLGVIEACRVASEAKLQLLPIDMTAPHEAIAPLRVHNLAQLRQHDERQIACIKAHMIKVIAVEATS